MADIAEGGLAEGSPNEDDPNTAAVEGEYEPSADPGGEAGERGQGEPSNGEADDVAAAAEPSGDKDEQLTPADEGGLPTQQEMEQDPAETLDPEPAAEPTEGQQLDGGFEGAAVPPTDQMDADPAASAGDGQLEEAAVGVGAVQDPTPPEGEPADIEQPADSIAALADIAVAGDAAGTQNSADDTGTVSADAVPAEDAPQPSESAAEPSIRGAEPGGAETVDADQGPVGTAEPLVPAGTVSEEAAASEAPPVEAEAAPAEADAVPAEAETLPAEADAPLTEAGAPPADAMPAPADKEADASPVGAGAVQADVGVTPVEAGTPPADVDAAPADGDAAPPKPDTAPADTDAAPTDTDAAPAEAVDGDVGEASAPAEPEARAPEDDRAQLLSVLGLDTHRHNNALLIDDDTLVTCIGSHVVFVSLSSDRRRYLRGLDGGGVGAVAVHPSRTLLAVGEKARSGAGPCVYIYTYPELKCIKVLRAGTERAYMALAFDLKGDTLASVGSFPDFLLTLWDWRAESIVLRAKAFSQDVYTVAFSPYFEGQLTTSGQGHIRFWRMASTFTGLKLQGALGKFGNVELSDVAGFVELPDGKVLSTTETGELLLWDGGLIKVVLLRPGGKPCHDGPVEVLLHDRATGVILSAGADGYVRVWDFNQVNDAEPREDGNSLDLRPLDEVLLAAGAHVMSLLWEGRRWVAVDRAGRIYVVALPVSGSLSKGASILCVGRYPAGAVAGLALSPQSHACISASRDGQMRVLDYRTGATLAEAACSQPITAFAALPAAIAPAAMAAVAGYRDGVVRVYTRAGPQIDEVDVNAAEADGAAAEAAAAADSSPFPEGLALAGVAKPHKGAVLALAVSPKAGGAGGRLATCGEDGTVFFFDVAPLAPRPERQGDAAAWGALVPRAYVRLAQGGGAVTCATWSADGDVLLLGTSRGSILQVPLPPEDLDTHHSYEWPDAVIQTYNFCVPKPKRPKKKSKKGKDRKEGDDGGEDGDGQEGAGGGQDADAAEGDAEGGEEGGEKGDGEQAGEGDDEADEADQGGPDEVASSSGELLTIALAPDDPATLLVTAGGNGHAARKVWRVNMAEPLAVALMDGFASAPVTFFGYTADGGLALLGSGDGLVRVQPLDGPYGSPAGPFWESPLHDMQAGRVTSVAVSYDGAFLLSAARDGAVHLLALQLTGAVEAQEPPQEVLPDAKSLPSAPADVTSPTAYTLEEEKQQAERDQQVRMAEEKKLSVRERLARIRAEFESLLAENESQAEALRLSREELEVDPGLRELMEAEALRREEVARLELAWESERQRLGLAKLRAYFLEGVETERVALYSLRNGSIVTTFRTAKLSEETRAELAALRAAAAAAASAAAAGAEGTGRDMGGDARKGSDTGGGSAGDPAAPARARLAEATAALEEGTASGKLNKADLRRLSRKRREAEWAAFNATRPDDTYDSPADLKAIQEARRTIGDFKLKSDPNFVVPEEERMTPQRKRHAMLELEEALYDIKHAFNEKFFALRDVKRKVLSDVRVKLNALADLAALASSTAGGGSGVAGGGGGADAETTATAYLAPFASIPASLLPDEQPAEAREAVTDDDLAAFAARKQEEERKAAAVAAGGLGGFATAGAKRPAGAAAGPAAHGGGAGGGAAGGGGGGPGGPGGLSASEEALAKMMAAVPQSELEKGLAAYNRRRVEHMRNKLTEEINSMIEAFDDAHGALKAEKLGLEADVKAGEMRLLVMLQELQLLREFDKRESVLLQKRQAKLDDKQEIVDKITECTDKLEQKRVELEGLIARRAAVIAELDAILPETDPYREPLVRIFHRRIKRSKKKAGGGDDDYDSDDDDDEDEMGDDEADDDDDGGEEVCPAGCDQSVYERVCDLREKRLDEEDMIAEFQKTIEVLRKEKEALAKKQRLVEQGLAAVNADMAEFQKEKQGRLNQVEVVVSLKMHQVEYLIDGCLPDDLSAALVFSATQLRRLQRRVDELEDEKAALRAAHKDLKREQAALLKDKAEKEKKVAELEARAHDVQMLKFGQVIDLELLDKVSSSRGTEDLKEELRKQELQYARELAEWDAKIAARMDELVVLTRENTACLNAVSELTAAQRKLETGLTATRKGLFSDPVQQRKAEVEERDALVQLVNAQAQEIDRLKTQLVALRRKDTSMYT
ncbi:Cilia- and flagella-associated protein 44 [Pleodorina starrii]|nr:Cilia- and flagella-associated protein 44 [Pleodorina starrii]